MEIISCIWSVFPLATAVCAFVAGMSEVLSIFCLCHSHFHSHQPHGRRARKEERTAVLLDSWSWLWFWCVDLQSRKQLYREVHHKEYDGGDLQITLLYFEYRYNSFITHISFANHNDSIETDVLCKWLWMPSSFIVERVDSQIIKQLHRAAHRKNYDGGDV
jgi:hypothetical protein